VSTSLPIPSTADPGSGPIAQQGQPPSRRPMISNTMADKIFAALARGAALLTLCLLLAIMASLFVGAWPAIRE